MSFVDPWSACLRAFRKKLRKVFRRIEEVRRNGAWRSVGQVEGCHLMQQKLDNSSFHVVQGSMVTEIESSPADFVRFVFDVTITDSVRGLLPNCVFYRQLHHFPDESMDVVHVRQSNSFPSGPKDRDFILVRQILISRSGAVAHVFGCTVPNHFDALYPPETQGVIRGVVSFFSWRANRVKGGRLRVSWLIHVEPNGLLPALVFNSVLHTRCLCVAHYIAAYRLQLRHNLSPSTPTSTPAALTSPSPPSTTTTVSSSHPHPRRHPRTLPSHEREEEEDSEAVERVPATRGGGGHIHQDYGFSDVSVEGSDSSPRRDVDYGRSRSGRGDHGSADARPRERSRWRQRQHRDYGRQGL